MREEKFGPLRTATVSPVPQDTLLAVVRARVWGAKVFLNVTGSGVCALVAGRFDMDAWRRCFDRYALPLHASIAAYADSGTVIGIYLIDEPNHPTRWGPEGTVTQAMVEAMAAYSKSLWPTIPTVVRAAPEWLAPAAPYTHLDVTWGQYACRRGNLIAWRDQQVRGAKALKMGLVLSVNAIDGGCTSAEMARVAGDPAWFDGFQGSVEGGKQFYAMGPGPLRDFGVRLVPFTCVFLKWQYRREYSEHAEIRQVDDDLARLAQQQTATPCQRST